MPADKSSRSRAAVPFGPGMEVEAREGSLNVQLGAHFGVAEAERLSWALASRGSLPRVTLDFKEVREFEVAALWPLSLCLHELGGAKVTLRGLTGSQARILGYCRSREPEVAASLEGRGDGLE